MDFKQYSYRNAEMILSSKMDRFEEIRKIISQQKGKHPIDTLRLDILKGFEKYNWSSEKIIHESFEKQKTFGSFRDRIAVEIEFSRYENVFRDYFRFLLAFREDTIDVGVLILYSDETRKHYGDPNIAPYLEMCQREIQKMNNFVIVPIFFIGITS